MFCAVISNTWKRQGLHKSEALCDVVFFGCAPMDDENEGCLHNCVSSKCSNLNQTGLVQKFKGAGSSQHLKESLVGIYQGFRLVTHKHTHTKEMHAYDPNQQTYHLLWMRHLYHTYSRCTSQVCSLLPLYCIHIHVAIPIDVQLQEQSLCMTSSSECVSFEVCRAVVLSREFFSFSHWGAPWTRCFNLTTLKQNKTVLRTISQHPKTNLEFVKKSNSSHQATKIEPYPVISFELNLTPPLNLPWPTTTPLNFFQNNTSIFIPPKNADTENQKQPPPHKRVTTPKPNLSPMATRPTPPLNQQPPTKVPSAVLPSIVTVTKAPKGAKRATLPSTQAEGSALLWVFFFCPAGGSWFAPGFEGWESKKGNLGMIP